MGSAKDFDAQSPTSSTPKSKKFLNPSVSLTRLPKEGNKRRFSEEQVNAMSEAFDEDPNPSQASIVKIAEKVDLTHGQVEVKL